MPLPCDKKALRPRSNDFVALHGAVERLRAVVREDECNTTASREDDRVTKDRRGKVFFDLPIGQQMVAKRKYLRGDLIEKDGVDT